MPFDSDDQSLETSLGNETDVISGLAIPSGDIITPDSSQTSSGVGFSDFQQSPSIIENSSDYINSVFVNSLSTDSEWNVELTNSDTWDILGGGLEVVQSKVQDFLRTANASQIISETFDGGADASDIISILEEIAQGEWQSFPTIQLVSGNYLKGAHGAYESSTDTILLSNDLLTDESARFELLPAVLLEELSHGIDAKTGLTDSSGDEGFIFAATLQGIDLSESVLMALKAEDDSTTIVINGRDYVVEQSQIAMTTLNGKLYQAVRDENDYLQIRASTNGYDWSQWQQIGNNTFKTVNAPEIESFNNKIYFSYRGTDGQILAGKLDPSQIDSSGNVIVDGVQKIGGATPDSLSMKATDDELYIFHRGLDNEIYYKTISKQLSEQLWVLTIMMAGCT